MNSRQKQHGCRERERERERAIFYQKRKEAILFNQFSLWRKEGVLSTLRDRSMNYVGYLIDKDGNKFFPDLYDSGWKIAELSSNFKQYNDNKNNKPRYRRIGNMVQIKGIVSPKSTIEGSTAMKTIFNLPDGFKPSVNTYQICQGTGMNRWLLTVYTTGEVGFSRYGTNNLTDASTTVWLPFNVVYFTE